MKKLRFAIQVVMVMAAFPVLFIVGVTHHEPKPIDQQIKMEEPIGIDKSTGLKYQGFGLIGIIKYYNVISI